MTGTGAPDHLGEVAAHDDHQPRGIFAALGRVVLIFVLATLWCFVLAIAYSYGGRSGVLGWIRLPEGLAPFQGLNLGIADIGALAALFVAILLAAMVQLNSTVGAADDIASEHPTDAPQARRQQHRLRFYANQAEMSMIASFGAAFAVLMLTVLLGLSDMADLAEANQVDIHGVGWAGFFDAAQQLDHPRFVTMLLVSLLLFLTTYASLPEWKNTGLFQRQVEDNAWEAAERLKQIASRHSLPDVDRIPRPRFAVVAAVAGYALYVTSFALVLNVSLALIAGGDGFTGIFAAGHWFYFFLFALLGVAVSTAVGTAMLWFQRLHGQNNFPIIISLVLGVGALLYIVSGEGLAWGLAVGVVVLGYGAWWAWLYFRSLDVLAEKRPAVWEFVFNPPKYLTARRYETIRRSAAMLAHLE